MDRAAEPAALYKKERGFIMIELTKMNNTIFTMNDDLIETIEETPDTVITLTTGKKLIVRESRQEAWDLAKSYRKELYRQDQN